MKRKELEIFLQNKPYKALQMIYNELFDILVFRKELLGIPEINAILLKRAKDKVNDAIKPEDIKNAHIMYKELKIKNKGKNKKLIMLDKYLESIRQTIIFMLDLLDEDLDNTLVESNFLEDCTVDIIEKSITLATYFDKEPKKSIFEKELSIDIALDTLKLIEPLYYPDIIQKLYKSASPKTAFTIIEAAIEILNLLLSEYDRIEKKRKEYPASDSLWY